MPWPESFTRSPSIHRAAVERLAALLGARLRAGQHPALPFARVLPCARVGLGHAGALALAGVGALAADLGGLLLLRRGGVAAGREERGDGGGDEQSLGGLRHVRCSPRRTAIANPSP